MTKNKTQEEVIDIISKKHHSPKKFSIRMIIEAIDLYHDQFTANKEERDIYGIIVKDEGTHGCHKCDYYQTCKVCDEPCKTCVTRNGIAAYYKKI